MSNQLQGRRIALIGGAGFIGHNLALALKQQGAEVSIIDGLNVNNFLWVYSNGTVAENRDLYSANSQSAHGITAERPASRFSFKMPATILNSPIFSVRSSRRS